MAKNVAALARALKSQEAAPQAAPESTAPTYYKAPSRAGKLHLSAWLPPDFKSSLRAIQLQRPQLTLQDLFVEALNDLFSKYNVPVIRQD